MQGCHRFHLDVFINFYQRFKSCCRWYRSILHTRVSSLQSSSIKQIIVSIILHRFVAINNITEVNQLSLKSLTHVMYVGKDRMRNSSDLQKDLNKSKKIRRSQSDSTTAKTRDFQM